MRNSFCTALLLLVTVTLMFFLAEPVRADHDADARAAIALALAIQAEPVKASIKNDCGHVGCPCGCADGAPCICHQRPAAVHRTYQPPVYSPAPTYQWVQPSPYFRAPMSAFPPSRTAACRSG